MNSNISKEAIERFCKYTQIDKSIFNVITINSIPINKNGLGYQWYPIILTYSITHIEKIFDLQVYKRNNIFEYASHHHDCNIQQSENFFSKSLNNSTSAKNNLTYSENQIIKYIVKDIFDIKYLLCNDWVSNFLDPLEVENEINIIKNNYIFLGFMHINDLLLLNIDGETIHITKENSNQSEPYILDTKNYRICSKIEHITKFNNGRIFNLFMVINVNYLYKRKK